MSDTTKKTNMQIAVNSATTIYINHPESNWAVFCYNNSGDLFLNSDWGMYGFAWRHYGDDFKEFLKSLNAEYIVGKFQTNYSMMANRRMSKNWEKNLTVLTKVFIDILNKQ